MYLLDIVGVTATGHSFVIGQAFLSGEVTEDYTFVLQWLRDLYINAGLGLPLSVTTDQASGLLKALGEVFPEVPHLLCIWYVNKRVKAWVQQHWLNEIVRNTVIQGEAEQTTPEQRAEYIAAKQERFWPLWCAIWSNARTETDVEAAWQKLCGIYRAEYLKIISYLDTTWIKHRKLFCRF
jgi:transposase-like protein